jgi:hypothetical protein
LVEPDAGVLASAAAVTLVTLMATDAWAQVKAAFVSLWRRASPERAAAVDAELATAELEVTAARQAGDEQAELDLVGEWRSRLRRLAAGDEQVRVDLQRLVDEFRPLLAEAEAGPAPVVRMRAEAAGHGRVNQAGRDQFIVER